MPSVHVAGVGHTPFGRSQLSLDDLALRAADESLASADVSGVDAVVVGVMEPMGTVGEAHVSSKVMDALCLPPRAAVRVEAGPATGASALHAGFWQVASGTHATVLVVAAERLSHLGTRAASGVLARIATEGERALGITMPGMTALLARAYMHRHGATEEDLADLAVKAHALGARNPRAHMRRAVTREEVLAGPMVADPLRRHNCAPLSDGAVAVLLTSRDGAPVTVTGIGAATDRVRYQDRRAADGFVASRLAAERALGMARRGLADVQLVETHDAFSNLEWSNLEDMGLMPPGGALTASRAGETMPGGRLPVNPSGGLTAKGHPAGATGLGQVAEVFWQLAGEAEGPQVDARVGLSHSIGGFGASVFVTVLEAT